MCVSQYVCIQAFGLKHSRRGRNMKGMAYFLFCAPMQDNAYSVGVMVWEGHPYFIAALQKSRKVIVVGRICL